MEGTEDAGSAHTLRQQLKYILAAHTSKDVHHTLHDILKEEYDFLKDLFGKSGLTAPASPSPAPAAQPSVPSVPSLPKIRTDAKIRVVKAQPAAEQPEPPLALHPIEKESPAAPTEPLTLSKKKELRDKAQKEAEESRYKELIGKQIQPEDLLTKENLTEWVVTKKYSFAQIARELVGLPEAHIANVANTLGIKSQISQRRAAIAAAKAKKLSA